MEGSDEDNEIYIGGSYVQRNDRNLGSGPEKADVSCIGVFEAKVEATEGSQ